MLTLGKQMLRWKLREVMARAKITNRELAAELKVHETSVSRMKTADTMPRIDGDTLENLCNCLTKLYKEKGINEIVMPAALFEFTPKQ
ncbi:helix-turn-helix transcriptional regulator [Waterburya agarophytonicola K14]|uniref:Helix-turn-helix transcriptional regulator n=1 Tax=Waterburya agarophytonicola KI4 TaxID=2874699 RepID=A0A964BP85_9CYAN|nr:helix-turn-helix transcriptional regulator [Waterburya agarophytonicola]MCC0175817.1 helix-turn-helix transcriptional regulator [Waterburya agarophytonicola KI4]